LKQVHIYYSGSVQGVGFRFTAIDLARKFGIKGWVKNLADGRVELLAEGPDETLKNFLKDLDQQMAHYITDKQVSWEAASNKFSGFEIGF